MTTAKLALDTGPQLAKHLPDWDFHEVHRRRVAAPPSRAIQLALGLRFRDLPLTGALMALRLAPAALAARRWPFDIGRPWIDLFLELGFVELAREENEVVLGAVGQFWRFREELEPLASPADFERFDRPGFAKAAITLYASPAGAGSELMIVTRVWTPDERARRAFRLYWLPVRAAGEPIRRELLAAVARRAKQRN